MLIEKLDLKRYSLKEVREYLRMASAKPFEWFLEYFSVDHRDIFIASIDQTVVGAIGIDHAKKNRSVISHIAVHPNFRGQGIGRALIDEACLQLQVTGIEAETDGDADGFYRACGFDVVSLGEKYAGVERFLCTKAIGKKEENR